ncbi:MAG: methyltransferase domain-containing protein [Myxococcales bacterium]
MSPYEFRLKRERLWIEGGLTLEVESLASLDETIDSFFEFLEREGKPELLETLCPYFGVIWPAGAALARAVAKLPANALAGRSVLEIGCGLALPSMVAALRDARVLATDSHPEVPRFLERNRALNGGLPSLRYAHADWNEPPAAGAYDLVLGSDVLYEKAHAERVPAAIAAALAPGGRAIVADPGRPYLQAFVDRMREQGFESRAETVQSGKGEKDAVWLFEFRRA